MAVQMEKLSGGSAQAMVACKLRAEATAAKIIAGKLRSTESVSMGGK